jgi:hypothetical protein
MRVGCGLHQYEVSTPSSSSSSNETEKKRHSHDRLGVILLSTKKEYSNKVSYFSKTCYHTSFPRPKFNGANIDCTSQVRASAILLLTDCRKLKFVKLGGLEMHKVHTTVHENGITGSS